MLRILSSKAIIKVGVGIASDAQVFWEDTHINLINMVDAGLMARLVNVEKHQEEPYTNLSLNNAAAEVLGISVDKLYQKGVNWKREPHDAHKLCEPNVVIIECKELTYSLTDAALDAVISLRLYENLAPVLQADGASQGKAVPEDWYTFNSTMGETVRTRLSVRGEEVPWSTKDCSWYSGNKYQGKHFQA